MNEQELSKVDIELDLPEAFPAVTVPLPSVIKHGRSFWNASFEHPARGNSSLFTTTSPEKYLLNLICLSL